MNFKVHRDVINSPKRPPTTTYTRPTTGHMDLLQSRIHRTQCVFMIKHLQEELSFMLWKCLLY